MARSIAVAGTHVISVASAIAVVGNVYTHPRYRGQHFAQCTTAAVTEQLLSSCRDVVLSVDPTNAPAVRAYERLGYTEAARLVEGAATRRDAHRAPSALVRRALAQLRGRGSRRRDSCGFARRRRNAARATEQERGRQSPCVRKEEQT